MVCLARHVKAYRSIQDRENEKGCMTVEDAASILVFGPVPFLKNHTFDFTNGSMPFTPS